MVKKVRYPLKVKSLLTVIATLLLLNSLPAYGSNNDESSKEEKKDKVYYISEKKLPRKVTILPTFVLTDDEMDPSVLDVMNSVIKNYIAAKGFSVLTDTRIISKIKDSTVETFSPDTIFKDVKEIDGVFTVSIHKFTTLNIALVEWYKLDAEVCLYTREKKLGCWRETGKRKKFAIVTDPLSAIAELVSTVVTSSGQMHIKNTIFDWAFKVSGYIPGFSEAAKKPNILRVVSNVSDQTFKLGDKVVVGMEGDKGLSAGFDIGQYKKNIRMSETEPGIYKGVYAIQDGDKLTDGVLFAYLTRADGVKRDWIEAYPYINIDGIPPLKPDSMNFEVKEESMNLTWRTKDTETTGFVLMRSTSPLSDYTEIVTPKGFSYEDTDISPGMNYYYRVIALDEAGNTSLPVQVGPVALPVLTEQRLPDSLTGSFLSGKYFIDSAVKVPLGTKAHIGPDAIITMKKEAGIIVEGELVLQNVMLRSDDETWDGIEVASGGRLVWEGGEADNFNAAITIKGSALLKGLTVKNSSDGILIDTSGEVEVKDSAFNDTKRALTLTNGELQLENSHFENNGLALEIVQGRALIEHNSFLNNSFNIKSEIPLVLKGNYMGGTEPGDFLVQGEVEVRSVLTAPYPQGKEIEIDEEEFLKKGALLKEAGINAFKEGQYGKAYENFDKAMRLLPAKDTYIYYIYTLVYLKEDAKLKETVEAALQKFPYEVKIYKIAIRYYLDIGNKEYAKSLLDRGLRLNPGNPELEGLKVFVEEVRIKN